MWKTEDGKSLRVTVNISSFFLRLSELIALASEGKLLI